MRYVLILGIVVVTIVGVVTMVLGGDPPDRYIPETGHTIDARFVSFYDDHGQDGILGYPISVDFIDPKTGLLVQYFQNARLELVPEGENNWKVQFAPLGQMLYGWVDPGENTTIPLDSGCKFFPDTRYSVCYYFLEFFDDNGGVEVFGPPISNDYLENGVLVQYFQRFKFEYEYSAAPDEEFRIAALGQVHFEESGYNPFLLRPPVTAELPVYTVDELHLETSVTAPLVEPGAVQHVYVTVQDEDYTPIRGAATLMTVHFPTGTRFLLLPLTNEYGGTTVELGIDNQPTDSEVILEFLVMYGDLYAVARDSFLIR
ncbi:MAG: hypothetical protein GTO14_15095 [Anaerolineales bacterium]|nr:hypothetical protein [Anaerolineales bacterium]